MERIPEHANLPFGNHYRPRLIFPDITRVLGAIYAYNCGGQAPDIIYWYVDWFESGTGMKYSSDDLSALMKEVDQKLVANGYELLTEEEADRLMVLV